MTQAENKEELVKEKYTELQILGNTIKQLQAQVEAITERVLAVKSVDNSLDELKGVTAGSDSLVPVSEGIFVKATLKDVKELVVNVGGDVCVSKTIEETKELIGKRLAELEEHRGKLIAEMEKAGLQAGNMETEIAALLNQNVQIS